MQLAEQPYFEILDHVAYEGVVHFVLGPSNDLPSDIPAAWIPLITAKEPRLAISNLWRPMEVHLPRVCRALRERLHGVALLLTENGPVNLLYFFRGGDDWIIYRGRASQPNIALPAELPNEILEFYAKIHDGWVFYYSDDNGPLPHIDCRLVRDIWDGISWQLPPGEVSLGGLFAVYKDEDDFALAFDTSVSPALPVICRSNGQVELLLDLWTAMDREVGGFLERLDPADPDIATNNPAAGLSPGAIARYEKLLEDFPKLASSAARLGTAKMHEQAYEIAQLRALYDEDPQRPFDRDIKWYRAALDHWCASVESGGRADPEEILDLFGLAHSMQDRSSAQFVVSVPTFVWHDESVQAAQVLLFVSMLLGDTKQAESDLDSLLGLTFDGDTASAPSDEVTARLLESLCHRNETAFKQWRQVALERFCTPGRLTATQFPWTFRLAGFDALAAQTGLIASP